MAKTATAPSTRSSSKIDIRPLGDKVIVRRDEPETKTSSGIFLPETGKEKPMTATVQSVGKGRVNEKTGELIPPEVKPGQRVIISKWSGDEVDLDGTKLLIIGRDDILAVID